MEGSGMKSFANGYPVPKDLWERSEWDSGEALSKWMKANVGPENVTEKLKLHFKYDPELGWNQVNTLKFSDMSHVQNICGDITKGDNVICWADALNNSVMDNTEVTNFLYRFSHWYTESIAGKMNENPGIPGFKEFANQLAELIF
jgi:hypothetical protein